MSWVTTMDALVVLLTSVAIGALAHCIGKPLDLSLALGAAAGILTVAWLMKNVRV